MQRRPRRPRRLEESAAVKTIATAAGLSDTGVAVPLESFVFCSLPWSYGYPVCMYGNPSLPPSSAGHMTDSYQRVPEGSPLTPRHSTHPRHLLLPV